MSQPNESSLAGDTKPCPFCAEPIKVTALKCKHCRSYVGDHIDPAVKTAAKAPVVKAAPEQPAEPVEPAAPAADEFVNCLVCRNRYPASQKSCERCGALKGQNFVLAPGAEAPSSTHKSGERSRNQLLFMISLLVVFALVVTAIAILGFAAEKSAVVAIVVIVVVVLLAYGA